MMKRGIDIQSFSLVFWQNYSTGQKLKPKVKIFGMLLFCQLKEIMTETKTINDFTHKEHKLNALTQLNS